MLLFTTVLVRTLLACFSYLHVFLCVILIIVILSLLTNFHETWYEQHSSKRPRCRCFLYFPSINNTNYVWNVMYMSTETCVKCDTFRLYRASFTYLEFFISANYAQKWIINLYSFIPLACAECDYSLPFSGVSSIPLCYIPFPSTLFHHLVFHPPSLHLAIYFFVCLSASLFPN